MTCKGVVAAVMGRYGHDGTCAVACKHVVAYIDRNFLSGQRIHGIWAWEDSRDFLVDHAFALGLVLGAVEIFVDGLALFGGGDHVYIIAFRRKHHEGNSEHSVGAGSEDFKFEIRTGHFETHFGTFRTAYPVALGLFQRISPVETVEVIEEALGVGWYTQTPLIHQFLFHRITAADRKTFADLVIGEYRCV